MLSQPMPLYCNVTLREYRATASSPACPYSRIRTDPVEENKRAMVYVRVSGNIIAADRGLRWGGKPLQFRIW